MTITAFKHLCNISLHFSGDCTLLGIDDNHTIHPSLLKHIVIFCIFRLLKFQHSVPILPERVTAKENQKSQCAGANESKPNPNPFALPIPASVASIKRSGKRTFNSPSNWTARKLRGCFCSLRYNTLCTNSFCVMLAESNTPPAASSFRCNQAIWSSLRSSPSRRDCLRSP